MNDVKKFVAQWSRHGYENFASSTWTNIIPNVSRLVSTLKTSRPEIIC